MSKFFRRPNDQAAIQFTFVFLLIIQQNFVAIMNNPKKNCPLLSRLHLYTCNISKKKKRLWKTLNSILFQDIGLNSLYQKRFLLQNSFKLHGSRWCQNKQTSAFFVMAKRKCCCNNDVVAMQKIPVGRKCKKLSCLLQKTASKSMGKWINEHKWVVLRGRKYSKFVSSLKMLLSDIALFCVGLQEVKTKRQNIHAVSTSKVCGPGTVRGIEVLFYFACEVQRRSISETRKSLLWCLELP